jgi:hypothetical protein
VGELILISWVPCYFFYMNDLPQFISNKSTLILFADNTSIIFTHSNKTKFNSDIRTVFETINTLFNNNYLSLHFRKTCYTHFKTGNSPSIDMKIAFSNKLIPNDLSTIFLGLTVDGMLSWRMHIDHLTTKLGTACYVIQSIKPLMSKTLLLIYHSLFHRVKSYRIIHTNYNYFSQSHQFCIAKIH